VGFLGVIGDFGSPDIMNCRVAELRTFPSLDLDICAASLCWAGSEMQSEFCRQNTGTQLAIVTHGTTPVAWAASHVWRDLQTLEGFTHPKFRRRGLQRFAAAGLLAACSIDASRPIAVFSRPCVNLARSLGFDAVRLFRCEEDDWIEQATEDAVA
jgi:hypothetical protein